MELGVAPRRGGGRGASGEREVKLGCKTGKLSLEENSLR